jgi:hypothetical protein
MYQLNFSQHGLEQLKVPANSDIRETEASTDSWHGSRRHCKSCTKRFGGLKSKRRQGDELRR